jgi:hypothetical protein
MQPTTNPQIAHLLYGTLAGGAGYRGGPRGGPDGV